MEQMIALSTQNPLTLLVKFGMMAWNDTCGNENCSGHGECHNGTCLCEVYLHIILYFYAYNNDNNNNNKNYISI